MKFAIISGSTRHNKPQSSKVAKYIKQEVQNQFKHEVYLLDLSETEIKSWDETFWNDYNNFDANWLQASQKLRDADAIIIIAPEWNGMVPPALKNIFQLATKGEFANKPALIVSVSSGINGVYPITELRLNTYKNTFLNYIPQHVIVRNVNNVLNQPEITTDEDKAIRERISYTLQILQAYAEGFISIRKNVIIQSNTYPYGM